MSLTAVLDHTALGALYRADHFFTGLYIEASRGAGRVLVPSLSVLAAERQLAGTGGPYHLAALRRAGALHLSALSGRDSVAESGVVGDAPGGNRLTGHQKG